MLDMARRAVAQRRGVGSDAALPHAPARPPSGWMRQLTGGEEIRALARKRPTRQQIRAVLAKRPDSRQSLALLRRHRVVLATLGITALFAAADAPFAGLATGPVQPGVAQRIPVAYPLLLQAEQPSVRRYLNAIANGERLREQEVVTAAARDTMERAKAEAAAAAAGEYQPWLSGGARPGVVLPGGAYVLPTRGIFTSGFGSRWGAFHNGIDIANAIGTPIYAVADGTVIDAGPAQGFGLWVRIRHDDGAITVYGHMYDFFVSVGERVPAGLQIARMGNRGDSTGPHLHFEVVINGQHVDPTQWLALHGLTYS
ncbi:M23 family metallopeptidase [Nocardia panacis]|uniref:M23 family metallopeptidase n=1 Tax=Nocardia panacis TaxID=2340916 RepID=A0A3A4KE91_9NOCA|nr:M23 family metallopeptidase [Nocardia panacis]RJO78869.1 M23 family metallopeptidase [Nocardia panacis]